MKYIPNVKPLTRHLSSKSRKRKSKVNTITTTKMEMNLSKLNIAPNADVKVVERNEFEITGDIAAIAVLEDDGFKSGKRKHCIDKLRVVYNHDGMLEHIYGGEPSVPDNDLLFRDVEMFVNGSHGGQIVINFENDNYVEDVLLTDDNSINVFADLPL